jgi:filamin
VYLLRLLHWIQSKLPDLPITNFTADWNDGKAVGALVDAVAPGRALSVFAFAVL